MMQDIRKKVYILIVFTLAKDDGDTELTLTGIQYKHK